MAESIQINPDNDTMVGFLDLDGDPNEGHEEEGARPQFPTKVSNQQPHGDLEPEVEIDMTDAKDGEEVPAKEAAEDHAEPEKEETPPAKEEASPAEEQQAAADAPKKKSPWERTEELKRELAEQKRLVEEERKKREDTEKVAQEHKQRLEVIEQYLQKQAQAQQPPPKQEEPAPIPDYEENPLEHLKASLTETQKIIADYNRREQTREQQQVVTNFHNWIDQQEAEYARTTNPDYYDARTFLLESARQEGRSMGMSERQIEDTIEAYRVQMVATSREKNIPLGRIVEQVATQRGYQPKAIAVEPESQTQTRTPQEKVRNASERQKQASASLATTSRTTGKPNSLPSRDWVLHASEEEMEERDRADPGWQERYMQQR